MAVVALLQECGAFKALARALLSGEKSIKFVFATLVLLPFFSSMLITNDVALISFVPFAVLVLSAMERQDALIRIVVLQTVAANLGSMATPVGNPQNLFLFAKYELGAGEFFGLILPFAAISLVLLLPALCNARGKEQVTLPEEKCDRTALIVCVVLFALCLMSVFRLLDWKILTAVVAVVIYFTDKRMFRRVDWALLMTFICFFVFSGNLGRIPAINHALEAMMDKNALLASAAASQIISNVPAAVLLQPMTDNWQELLLGVDIGGLGTPVASLASLISLKLYMAVPGAKVGKYMLYFTAMNLLGLVLLLPLAALVV